MARTRSSQSVYLPTYIHLPRVNVLLQTIEHEHSQPSDLLKACDPVRSFISATHPSSFRLMRLVVRLLYPVAREDVPLQSTHSSPLSSTNCANSFRPLFAGIVLQSTMMSVVIC
jgi:hypothetical protein